MDVVCVEGGTVVLVVRSIRSVPIPVPRTTVVVEADHSPPLALVPLVFKCNRCLRHSPADNDKINANAKSMTNLVVVMDLLVCRQRRFWLPPEHCSRVYVTRGTPPISRFPLVSHLPQSNQFEIELVEDTLPHCRHVTGSSSHDVVDVLAGNADLLGESRLVAVALGEFDADRLPDALIHGVHVDTVQPDGADSQQSNDIIHVSVYDSDMSTRTGRTRTCYAGGDQHNEGHMTPFGLTAFGEPRTWVCADWANVAAVAAPTNGPTLTVSASRHEEEAMPEAHERRAPVDPANPRGFGVTHCTCCGQSVDIVGRLGGVKGDAGTCDYCAHGLQRYELLADELETLVAPWIRVCREREVSDRDIEDFCEIVLQRCLDHVAEAKGHYASPEAFEA